MFDLSNSETGFDLSLNARCFDQRSDYQQHATSTGARTSGQHTIGNTSGLDYQNREFAAHIKKQIQQTIAAISAEINMFRSPRESSREPLIEPPATLGPVRGAIAIALPVGATLGSVGLAASFGATLGSGLALGICLHRAAEKKNNEWQELDEQRKQRKNMLQQKHGLLQRALRACGAPPISACATFGSVIILSAPKAYDLMCSCEPTCIDDQYIDEVVGVELLQKACAGLSDVGLSCELNTLSNMRMRAAELASVQNPGTFYLVAFGARTYNADFVISHDPHHLFDKLASLMVHVERLAEVCSVGTVTASDKFDSDQIQGLERVLTSALATIGQVGDSRLNPGELINLTADMLGTLSNSGNGRFNRSSVLIIVEPSCDPQRPQRLGAVKYDVTFRIEDIRNKKSKRLSCEYSVRQWHIIFNCPAAIHEAWTHVFAPRDACTSYAQNVQASCRDTFQQAAGMVSSSSRSYQPPVGDNHYGIHAQEPSDVLPHESVSGVGVAASSHVRNCSFDHMPARESDIFSYHTDATSLVSLIASKSRPDEPKCFLSDALLISATEQYIQARSVVVGSRLLSWRGNVVLVRFMAMHTGEHAMVELHTSRGAKLLVTANHRIVVDVHGTYDTQFANELTEGDSVVCNTGVDTLVFVKQRVVENVTVVELVLDPDEPIEAFAPPPETILSHGGRSIQEPRMENGSVVGAADDAQHNRQRIRRSGQWRRELNSGRRANVQIASTLPETDDSFR